MLLTAAGETCIFSANAEVVTLAALRPDPMAVAHMGPTGGTTGLPKVVPRTHNSLVCGVEYATRAWDYDANDSCLLAGPVGHDLTFSKGFLGGVFAYARLVLLDTAEMGAVCRTIQEEKVSAIVWVPTLANRLVNFPQLAEYDLSSLKKMHSGGAASQPDMIRKVAALGCTYYNGYGGTEGQTTITRREDDFATVCGSVPLASMSRRSRRNAASPSGSGLSIISGISTACWPCATASLAFGARLALQKYGSDVPGLGHRAQRRPVQRLVVGEGMFENLCRQRNWHGGK